MSQNKLSADVPDRFILETGILQYLGRHRLKRVLFIGCQSYTSHYKKYFKNSEYWTIEIDPAQKKFGSKYHVIGDACKLDQYFKPGFFDAIIANGLIGFGVQTRVQISKLVNGCFKSLKVGGLLVLGWNDQPGFEPRLAEVKSGLKKFDKVAFPTLGTWRVKVTYGNNTGRRSWSHTFDFYQKP